MFIPTPSRIPRALGAGMKGVFESFPRGLISRGKVWGFIRLFTITIFLLGGTAALLWHNDNLTKIPRTPPIQNTVLPSKTAGLNVYLTDGGGAEIERVEVTLKEVQIKEKSRDFETVYKGGLPVILENGAAQKIGSAAIAPGEYQAIKLRFSEETRVFFKNGASAAAVILRPILMANFQKIVIGENTLFALINLNIGRFLKTVNGADGKISFVFEPPLSLQAETAIKESVLIEPRTVGRLYKKDGDATGTMLPVTLSPITLGDLLKLE